MTRPYPRRHTNKHGTRGAKTGSRARKLKRLARELGVPFGRATDPTNVERT